MCDPGMAFTNMDLKKKKKKMGLCDGSTRWRQLLPRLGFPQTDPLSTFSMSFCPNLYNAIAGEGVMTHLGKPRTLEAESGGEP